MEDLAMSTPVRRFDLPASEMPTAWYNIMADLPIPPNPPLNPATGEPAGPELLVPIFPVGLLQQEMSAERWIDIPGAVLEAYAFYRPSPLYRATVLERALDTPAKIYYKYEGVSPAGSHKPNTAIAQAYYNKAEGVKRIATETGAGQWGSALAYACSMFGLECMVYMVKVSYYQKPYRRSMVQAWGAEIVPSPSDRTETGRRFLAQDPDSPGSLGIAISEAIEDAASREDTKYSLGSVLNHVLLHQTIVGLEAKKQMDLAGDYPDVVIACHGGGSNFAGIAFPFLRDKLVEGTDVRLMAVEPTACPTLTKGPVAYDFGDTGKTTPLLEMYTLGSGFIPAGIHAGGLRYHGAAPLVSHVLRHGYIEATAVPQIATFKAAVQFARTEGIIPAPESAHAIYAVIREAEAAKQAGQEKVILFNLSGHGHFDMGAYDAYFAGELVDYELPDEEIQKALEGLPKVPK
jgi:tryptophan synthase beta chain